MPHEALEVLRQARAAGVELARAPELRAPVRLRPAAEEPRTAPPTPSVVGRTVAVGALLAVAATGAAALAHAQPPTCRMSRFAMRLGPSVSEATGQHTLVLRLVNRGGRACTFDGYPTIEASDRGGPIPFTIRHGGDQMVTASRPRTVVVLPDRSAFVVLNRYRCDRGDLRRASTLAVGVRGKSETATITMSDPYRALDYCGKNDPGSIVAVSPFEPTLRAALARH